MLETTVVSLPFDAVEVRQARVARSMADKNVLNTLRLVKQRTYICWVSASFIEPVAGWYLHAASVGKHVAEFDPRSDAGVRWEHFKADETGLVEFVFHPNRIYSFYLTPTATSEISLKREHIPWQVSIYSSPKEAATVRILFPAQLPADHQYSAFVAEDFRQQLTLGDLYAWVEREHKGLATDAPTFQPNANAQRMVNAWALNGLIEGGAMIAGRDLPMSEWRIMLPRPEDPTEPYHGMNEFAGFNWHYILSDPNASSCLRWTETRLNSALLTGEAAAVSIGDLIMLGDYYDQFEDLENPEKRPPVNVVLGATRTPRSTKAGLLIDRGVLGISSLLDDHVDFSPVNWKRVDAILDGFKALTGPTRFSEIHTLTTLMPMEKEGAKFATAESLLPWASGQIRPKLAAGLNRAQIEKLYKEGPTSTVVFQFCVTNGHYGELAAKNWAHFYPKNWDRFEEEHRKALEEIDRPIMDNEHPIPARAIARTAFGLHFLTDAFSAGHMRTPRFALGEPSALAAKLMHDVDNYHGLLVTDGFGHCWRAYGDNYLNGPAEATQKSFFERLNAESPASTNPLANRDRAVCAAGAALKQLHHQAQKHYEGQPDEYWLGDPPHPNALQHILWRNRPGGRVAHEELGPGTAAQSSDLEQILKVNIDGKLNFMRQYQPRVATIGPTLKENHPPLFNEDGSVNIKANAYKIVSIKGVLFLLLEWHDGYPLGWPGRSFSDIYYTAIFTQGAKAEHWMDEDEVGLLQLPEKLSLIKL